MSKDDWRKIDQILEIVVVDVSLWHDDRMIEMTGSHDIF
jgi:hypothetical protein